MQKQEKVLNKVRTKTKTVMFLSRMTKTNAIKKKIGLNSS